MITASAQMTDLLKQSVQTPVAYCLVQLATNDGANAASQTMLANILTYRLTRNQDLSTDTLELTFTDDSAKMFPINKSAPYAALFQPGVIDNKFLLYTGLKGSTGIGTPQFSLFNQSLLLKFTGYLESDVSDHKPFTFDKGVSLVDLTKQFRMQVNDTLPHPLYGDQTLAYFDPTYNLKPINPSGGNATQWQCDGRMFTSSSSDKQFGATHIPVAVYIDTTGGSSPSNTPVPGANYTFDYKNGIVTFTTPQPVGSVVSVAGNPTYMAPETMIAKLLYEKAAWSKAFINLDTSNILLPQYVADNKPLWQVLREIAGMTSPRFVPWQIWADENGTIRFYESRIDGPPVATFIQGQNMFNARYEFTSRQLRTVVRGDAQVITASGDQPCTAIAYNVESIDKYGLTEPLVIATEITQSVRHLSTTQAISHLNMLAAATLAQVSRPILTCTAEISWNPTLQIGDKVWEYDTRYGIDREYIVSQQTEEGGPNKVKHSVVLEEIYDSINFNMGLGAAVSGDGTAQGSTTAAPSTALIGAVNMGTGLGTYAYRDGQYAKDPVTGDPVVPLWTPGDSQGTNMNFNVFLNSLPAVAAPASTPPQSQYSMTNLPGGFPGPYGWHAITGKTYMQGTAPASPPAPLAAGDLVQIGPDNVFRYQHAGTWGTWNPAGNTTSPSTGGTQPYTGTSSTVYVWQWFYLCLDGSGGVGKNFRPLMRVNPTQDGAAQAVGATGGLWLMNSWGGAPGPSSTANVTKYYGNLVVGLSDYTATPAGFVGANVMGDGVNVGVAYGADAPGGTTYVNYRKRTKGHYCVFACNSNGARQFLRIPFILQL